MNCFRSLEGGIGVLMEGWINGKTDSFKAIDSPVTLKDLGKVGIWFVLINVIISTCVSLSISELEETLVMN